MESWLLKAQWDLGSRKSCAALIEFVWQRRKPTAPGFHIIGTLLFNATIGISKKKHYLNRLGMQWTLQKKWRGDAPATWELPDIASFQPIHNLLFVFQPRPGRFPPHGPAVSSHIVDCRKAQICLWGDIPQGLSPRHLNKSGFLLMFDPQSCPEGGLDWEIMAGPRGPR